MEAFARRLKEHRKARSWSQAELAERCDLLRKQISDYERGINRPSLEILVRLAGALEVTLDDLVLDDEGGNGKVRSLRDLAAEAETLPAAQRQALKQVLRAFLECERPGNEDQGAT